MNYLQQPLSEIDAFINVMHSVMNLYLTHGTRSNKNVDFFHHFIKSELEKIFTGDTYAVRLEVGVPSMNSVGRKKCDIVVLKDEQPHIIFPVKIIKSNYKQNKNNGWENLTGELMHIHWSNPHIAIIPINIFMDKTPYLSASGIITKFEDVTYSDISNYTILKEKGIAYDIMNYILEVEHSSKLNERFDKLPTFRGFNSQTPFRSLREIVRPLLHVS